MFCGMHAACTKAEAESRSKSLEQMRQTMLQAAQEAEEERRLRQERGSFVP